MVALERLAVVALKSAACKYWASSGSEVFARILFTIFYDCCELRGTFHIPVFLFMVPLIIYHPFFWIGISCLSSEMVHPSSHKSTNYINGSVCILGKMWICIACLLISGRWSVSICIDSIVLLSGSLGFISFYIITGAILGVDLLARCIFAPESAIVIMLVLFVLGGLWI